MAQRERKAGVVKRDKADKWNHVETARYFRDLQENEVRTMHYLGLAYVVLSRRPNLQLKVPLSTQNYEDGASVGAGERGGYALQLLFTCAANYPLARPLVEIVEKRNVSDAFEQVLRKEIDLILEEHLGLQMIVPVVTRLQITLNTEMKRQRF
uniref:AT23338p n=1 Tax=Drosophila melanogaster TaxID=7227 RepID=Q8MZ95_DROME|nr:AT23338p [Drosophila melanogaster]